MDQGAFSLHRMRLEATIILSRLAINQQQMQLQMMEIHLQSH